MRSTPDHSENFEALRKLLALTRYEQPPPGYFRHFPDEVIARIEAEESSSRLNWWGWLKGEIRAKPALASAYGLILGALVVLGMGVSRSVQPDEADSPLFANTLVTAFPAAVWRTPTPPAPGDEYQFVRQTDPSSSVTPVLGRSSPFSRPPWGRAAIQPASYQLP